MNYAWLVVGAVMDDETVMKFAQADLNQSVKWGLYRLGLHDDKGFIKLWWSDFRSNRKICLLKL
jgi:hypothetical protein